MQINEKYVITDTSSNEANLFYMTDDPVCNDDIGCIGRLRADFGKNGNELWSTWMDLCRELKTPAFCNELDDIINNLRESGVLKNRAAMREYLVNRPRSELNDSRGKNYGFKIETVNYVYYFRFILNNGDYDFYCFAYDRGKLGGKENDND